MEEVGPAEQLIGRILYLESTPKIKGGAPTQANSGVGEVLKCDL